LGLVVLLVLVQVELVLVGWAVTQFLLPVIQEQQTAHLTLLYLKQMVVAVVDNLQQPAVVLVVAVAVVDLVQQILVVQVYLAKDLMVVMVMLDLVIVEVEVAVAPAAMGFRAQ
jgi:hypothetical protein